ncbi:MAG: signal peptide peptidase SppA [SAR86 cluster bacterium]|nr:signal peptide peptidase SppA [SAR86 cluster bacterium]
MNETTKMNRFWEWVTTARKFTINLLFLLIVLIFLGALLGSIFSGSKLPDPEGKALVVNPQGPIVEQVAGSLDPLSFALYGPPTPGVNVRNVLFALKNAKEDERIEHVILQLDNIEGTGQTVLYDVGQALQELKDSGKNIVAVSDYYSESSYYLASFANEIIMHPDGAVDILGYSRIRTYYKTLIDKLEVTVNLFRVGKFKSAMEPYIRDNMSDAAKEASIAYLNVLWDSWKKVVSTNRDLETEDIQNYADTIDELVIKEIGDTGKTALNFKLVDKLLNRNQQRDYLIDLVGSDEEEKSFAQVSLRDYFAIAKEEEAKNKSKNKIAVVVASGSIVDGTQPPGMIGGDSTAQLLREAHEDEEVKAIVLRVDSGGGSAFASEVIREEIVIAKSKDIKVIASMSNVAASGGYWISASADEIWASHDTITGSIGIFGFLPTFEKTLDKIGVHTDGISTTKIGTGIDPMQPINPILARVIQSNIEHGYQRFIKLVSESRNMTLEEVDEIAQGRVWAGEKALEIGLIDNLGNMEDAVKRAADLADLEDYKTFYPSLPLEWTDQILKQFFSKVVGIFGSRAGSKDLIKRSIELVNDLETYNDPKGIYLKCLDCLIY